MKLKNMKKLRAIIQEFRDINGEMNVDTIAALMVVAENEGTSGRDIEAAMDVPSSTAARYLRYFDKIQTNGKPGHDLVEQQHDSLDYRAKLRVLNPNGELLFDRIEKIIEKR